MKLRSDAMTSCHSFLLILTADPDNLWLGCVIVTRKISTPLKRVSRSGRTKTQQWPGCPDGVGPIIYTVSPLACMLCLTSSGKRVRNRLSSLPMLLQTPNSALE